MKALFFLSTSFEWPVTLFMALPLTVVLFYLSNVILGRLLKKEPKIKITGLALLSCFVTTPLVLGVLTFLFIQAKTPSEKETEQRYYKRLETEIEESKLVGKTKEEVVDLFGEGDTTKTTLIYDFSLPQADQQYILVITFKGNQVLSYRTRKG